MFSTPEATSQEQTEILIHLLKKLAPVNDIDQRRVVEPIDAPRDFGPEVAFGAKFQVPVARQGGREMSAPRPYVTDPFRPLCSINKW